MPRPLLRQLRMRFEEAFQPAQLERTLYRILISTYEPFQPRTRLGTPPKFKLPIGWDRLTPGQFAQQYHQHMSAISRKALDGRYTLRPYLSRQQPKKNGGHRTVAYSGLRDRIVQYALADVLRSHVEDQLTDSTHAYRRGFSCHTALEVLCDRSRHGTPWIFKSDFSDFFDSLDHNRLHDLIWSLPIDERAKTLCWRCVRTGSAPASQEPRTYPQSRQAGVPQGGVISGLLANLYLAEFDKRLRAESPVLIRYADDFMCLCESEQEAQAIGALAEQFATDIKLGLSASKTHIMHVNEGIEFLGLHLKGTLLSITSANIEKFKQRLRGRLAKQVERLHWSDTDEERVEWACWHVNRLILGYQGPEGVRSWLAYFRITNDTKQLQDLNRSIWQEVQRWCRKWASLSPSHQQLRERYQLRSVVTEYWKLRHNLPTPRIEYDGWVS